MQKIRKNTINSKRKQINKGDDKKMSETTPQELEKEIDLNPTLIEIQDGIVTSYGEFRRYGDKWIPRPYPKNEEFTTKTLENLKFQTINGETFPCLKMSLKEPTEDNYSAIHAYLIIDPDQLEDIPDCRLISLKGAIYFDPNSYTGVTLQTLSDVGYKTPLHNSSRGSVVWRRSLMPLFYNNPGRYSYTVKIPKTVFDFAVQELEVIIQQIIIQKLYDPFFKLTIADRYIILSDTCTDPFYGYIMPLIEEASEEEDPNPYDNLKEEDLQEIDLTDDDFTAFHYPEEEE